MLDIQNISYRVGGRLLFDGASAQLPEGHKIGLVGRNGTGKSTLFSLIAGEIEPDGGDIRMPRATRIGTVEQEMPSGAATPLEIVLAADKERARLLAAAEADSHDPHEISEIHEQLLDIDAHAAPTRAAIILAGLGFDEEAQHRPISSFSGGWRMRVSLAAALFTEPDLLLLDEPTNHLDLEAATWLEAFLQTYPRTLLVISHDRDFLNQIADGIVHIEGLKLNFYRGNYDRFERARREKIALTAAMRQKQEAQREHMQAYIDRFRYKASKARQAQSRIKALARMEPLDVILRDPEVVFDFPQPTEMSPPLITLDDASVGYDGKAILSGLSLRVDPDDRIALVGANGNGKTTLVRFIAGQLAAIDGKRVASGRIKTGYFAQHQVDELRLDESAFQHFQRLIPDGKESHLRGLLGRFGFGQERAETKVGKLSGGEKARLTLALITHNAPHLLILDEPTNHLDMEARAALIDALADYNGAVIVVSHDRHLVERVADSLWLVADGTAKPLDGDLESYRNQISGGGGKAKSAGAKSDKKTETVVAKRPAATVTKPRVNPSLLRKNLRDAEMALAKLTSERDHLDRLLTEPRIMGNPQQLAEIARHRDALQPQLEQAERLWLEAASVIEELGLVES
ncbi:MAG: ABC-F family ATP-binding cassette domain-containing protein [Candidatus Pacebacteria bacterium]|nr:ABC-F family ATP-binding cassette domain-containing protein [Candidatus Paceibacterota bacterium]